MTHFLCSIRMLTALVFVLTALASATLRAGWTLNEALIPQGFSLEVNHRTRYEFLNDEFRAGQTGETDVVAFRTLVHGRIELPFGLTVGAELQDSRAELNANTQLNTTTVNSVELLRAYLELDRPDTAGGNLVARAGRMTMDVGSRRLVARNRFRNTINSFTGVDIQWLGNDNLEGLNLRGFWTLPVVRQPETQERLLDNDIVFDDENLNLQFWGLFVDRDLPVAGRGELYVFGLHERDAPNRPTRNRQLVTPGFRLFQKPAAARFDYQL